jgi:hypothetical protein
LICALAAFISHILSWKAKLFLELFFFMVKFQLTFSSPHSLPMVS